MFEEPVLVSQVQSPKPLLSAAAHGIMDQTHMAPPACDEPTGSRTGQSEMTTGKHNSNSLIKHFPTFR